MRSASQQQREGDVYKQFNKKEEMVVVKLMLEAKEVHITEEVPREVEKGNQHKTPGGKKAGSLM